MKTFGILLLIIGGILCITALTMDVSVPVQGLGDNSFGMPSRVNNLGLMQDRQNYLIISCLMILIGIVLTVSGKKGTTKVTKKYKEYLEAAKLAEYKEQTEIAIDNYLNAAYHLENDFKKLSRSDEASRAELLTTIKEKIEILKAKGKI